MPYNSREELPKKVKNPLKEVPRAQEIYKNAFNSALNQYDDESTASAVAWSAVKNKYYKSDDGKWHKK